MTDRPETLGFQKPIQSGKTKRVNMPFVKDNGVNLAHCTCGWLYSHARKKVREDAIERHVNRKHAGRAIWT